MKEYRIIETTDNSSIYNKVRKKYLMKYANKWSWEETSWGWYKGNGGQKFKTNFYYYKERNWKSFRKTQYK